MLAVRGSKTAGIHFQLTSVLPSYFWKVCTHSTTDNTDVSWKLVSSAKQLTSDFQLTSVFPAYFWMMCTHSTIENQLEIDVICKAADFSLHVFSGIADYTVYHYASEQWLCFILQWTTLRIHGVLPHIRTQTELYFIKNNTQNLFIWLITEQQLRNNTVLQS